MRGMIQLNKFGLKASVQNINTRIPNRPTNRWNVRSRKGFAYGCADRRFRRTVGVDHPPTLRPLFNHLGGGGLPPTMRLGQVDRLSGVIMFKAVGSKFRCVTPELAAKAASLGGVCSGGAKMSRAPESSKRNASKLTVLRIGTWPKTS
jgi:hypothetical protein